MSPYLLSCRHPPTPHISTLSLHDALPISYDPAKFYNDPRLYRTIGVLAAVWLVWVLGGTRLKLPETRVPAPARESPAASAGRSEEHTSELQSRVDLVCRLLLEKKNKTVST